MTSPFRKPHCHAVWADALSWIDLPVLLSIYRVYGQFRLFFVSASKKAPFLFGFLKAIKIVTPDSLCTPPDNSAFQLDDSESLFIQSQATIENFLKNFSLSYNRTLISLRYPDPRVDAQRAVSNSLATAATYAEKLMLLVGLARSWGKKHELSTKRFSVLSHYAIIARPCLSSLLGEEVDFQIAWSWRHSFALNTILAGFIFFNDIFRKKNVPLGRPPSVAIAHHIGIDRSQRLDELHWWWNSGIPADRLVLFFDRKDIPAKASVVFEAQKLGITCVALKKNSMGNCPNILWRRPRAPFSLSTKRLGRKLKVLVLSSCRGPAGRWIACQVIQTMFRVERLEDFLRQYNVKGIFHYQVGGSDWISLGCEAADGVRFGEERSHTHWPSPTLMGFHHIYFVWGKHDIDALLQSRCVNDRFILVGCILRGSFPGHEVGKNILEARSLLDRVGVKRVITLFDSSVPCNQFYSFFLTRVLSDNRWGVLIKPKWEETLPWISNPQSELSILYKRLAETNRIVVLNSKESPGAAAAVADFSVGVDINTATVVAALAGHRTIHMDYLRLQESSFKPWAKFFKAGPDELVFNSPEKLWDSLNQYFVAPSTRPLLGVTPDHLLVEIDPFRDGLASHRMGEYIQGYLDLLGKGISRTVALETMDTRYTSKWGIDKLWKPKPIPVV